MKVHDVLNCSFSNWYPLFKKITIKSVILPFPEGFTEYLLADGLVLPDSDEHKPATNYDQVPNSSESETDWNSSDVEVAQAPCFANFDEKIKETINDLGGSVFPKLNWSSPKDAVWIAMNNRLQCQTVTDIYLLLKSSDFIVHDLMQPFQKCDDHRNLRNLGALPQTKYELVLRRWTEIDPGTEFRCFVKDHNLLAISQRDHTSHYEHIEPQKQDITTDITSFFGEYLEERFPSDCYVFDVYRRKKDEVKLIDFNPYGEVTDSLLFDWEELDNIATNYERPEFRCLPYRRSVQPNPLRHYGMPRDVVDLSCGEDPYKLIDLLRLHSGSEAIEESSDEETMAQ